MIEREEWSQAVDALEEHIAANGGDDDACYRLGRVLWKLDERAKALACYRRAVSINPESPARHALAMATDVFNFYNPDLLNPSECV